ncbi:MAG: hypothetical protein ACFFDX_04710 [Candidatus Odinarchaeota archaeon]
MDEKLKEIELIISNSKKVKINELKTALDSFFLSIHNKIDDYVGDYPTFIEPVHLGNNVKIGDDVLLGPNVYIGKDSEIGNYTEISNSIIFEKVKIGENLKLENCLIIKNSILNFSNSKLSNCILMGSSDSEQKIKKIKF